MMGWGASRRVHDKRRYGDNAAALERLRALARVGVSRAHDGGGAPPSAPAVDPSFWRGFYIAIAISIPLDATLAYLGWWLS